jgi:hypothetical protein
MENTIVKIEKDYKSGRDARGRFIKGEWGGGPGQRVGEKIRANYLKSLSYVKSSHIKRIYFALLNQCLKGNIPAIRVYLDRFTGKIPDKLEVQQTILTDEKSPEELRKEFNELFLKNNPN